MKNFFLRLGTSRIDTNATSIALNDLKHCEKYFIGVTLANQSATTIPSDRILYINTSYDVTAAPQHIHFHLEEESRSINISWEHSCHLPGNHPIEYTINITDVVFANTTTIRVPANDNMLQMYHIRPIARGARYNITISSPNQMRSTISVYQVHAFKLPSPSPLMVLPLQNESYVISWPRVRYNETE